MNGARGIGIEGVEEEIYSREEVPECEETPGVTSDNETLNNDHVIEIFAKIFLRDKSCVNGVEMETGGLQLALNILHTHS
jgi:hypothetical protein